MKKIKIIKNFKLKTIKKKIENIMGKKKKLY
jgi:hypothetical protein